MTARAPAASVGDVAASTPADLVDALGAAWATHLLYDDPSTTEAFGRAVERLADAPYLPWSIEVSPEGFVLPAGEQRDASRRLARQAFAHGGGAIELLAPPSAADLAAAFTVLQAEPPGGDDAAVATLGVTSIALVPRQLVASDGTGGTAAVGWSLGYDRDAAPFVHRLLESAGDAPVEVAEGFVAEYERVFALVESGDHWGLEEVVHTFVDAISFLPRSHQAAVLDRMLEMHEDPAALVFLDQLGSEEIGHLARHLAPETHPLLADYARIAADQGERRHVELLALIADASTTTASDTIVTDVGTAAGRSAVEAPNARLAARRPSTSDDRESAYRALQSLLAWAEDAPSFERSAAIWAGRVAAALRAGDVGTADRWFGCPRSLSLSTELLSAMRRALAAEVDVEVLDRLVPLLGVAGGPDVITAAPLFVVDGIAASLADTPEIHPTETTALAAIVELRPDLVVARLSDDSPSVLLPFLHALQGRVRGDDADRVVQLMAHSDHRVRREALSVIAAGGDASRLVQGLDDESPDVRERATELIARAESDELDRLLEAVVGDRTATSDRRQGALAALAARRSDGAHAVVARWARRRFVLDRTARALRRTARTALRTKGAR